MTQNKLTAQGRNLKIDRICKDIFFDPIFKALRSEQDKVNATDKEDASEKTLDLTDEYRKKILVKCSHK